jgi:hypothetical protein
MGVAFSRCPSIALDVELVLRFQFFPIVSQQRELFLKVMARHLGCDKATLLYIAVWLLPLYTWVGSKSKDYGQSGIILEV